MSSASDTEPASRARAAMADIAAHALQTNRQRLQRLEQVIASAGRGVMSEDERREAIAVAHQLVGSAGTFGYGRVSRLARRLEQHLHAGLLADSVEVKEALLNLPMMDSDLQGEPEDDDREDDDPP